MFATGIAVIAIGWSNPVEWAVMAGFGIGLAAEGLKNYIWENH